jgi:hypothetical protein
MIHRCREAAAVSLLVIQFSNRATSLVGRNFKLVRLSAASVSAAYRWRGILMRRGLSVHPAPNNGRPRRDNRTGRTDDRRCRQDGSPAGGDAACANHPRAQTTAPASIVLRAMRLPASNTGIIRCFMTALLGLLFCCSGNRGTAACRDLAECRLRRGGNCGSLSGQCASVVNQALQPVGCHVQCGIIHRALVSSSGFGALRL